MRLGTLIALLCLLLCIQLNAATRYARNFKIERKDTYTQLTVINTKADPVQRYRYALVPKAQPFPKLVNNIHLIRTPVE